jgi:arylformamidase
MAIRYVDLSHPIIDGMVTYPGLPAPRIYDHITRDESARRLTGGVSFHIGGIELVANTGTYLDAPFHFHTDGPDVAALPLDRLVDIPIEVVRATTRHAIGADAFGAPERLRGRAVLVHTGWSERWGSEAYLSGSPFITADAARLVIASGALLLGIDALNVDDTGDLSRPVHNGVLGAGIPLLEHLTNLDQVPDTGARLTALPAPVRGMGTFPVRAVAAFQERSRPGNPVTTAPPDEG